MAEGIQYDDLKRPYIEIPMANGTMRKVYLSPVAMGGKAPEDTTSILRSRPQWNAKEGTWETPVDWGNILNIAAASGLTAGAIDAALAGGGAAAGTGSGASAAGPLGIPTSSVSGIPAAMTPAEYAAMGAAGATGTGAADRAAAGAGGAASRGFGLRDILGLGVAGAGLANGMREPPANKQIEQLLGLATDRVNSSKPLYDALNAMAMAGLPRYAKEGQR